jgi:23S rRNA pseudouridine1911/1915/1917 synthase
MEKSNKPKRKPKGKPNTNASFEVAKPDELMKFLIDKLPGKSRNNIKSLLSGKQVFVDGKPIKQFNHPLVPGQQVNIRWSRVAPEKKYRGISIIYEDKDIVVVDKHAGLLSIPTDHEKSKTALQMVHSFLQSKGQDDQIFVVQRLDRDVSGLMVFARTEKVQHVLQSRWQDIISEMVYLAVVEGTPEKLEGTVTSYLKESKSLLVYSSPDPKDGAKAITHYQVIKSGKVYAILKIKLETSRKNQLRVHMNEIGHPVVGDKKYGATTSPIGRLGLHAWGLAFKHPVNNESLQFETPIPRKFLRLI